MEEENKNRFCPVCGGENLCAIANGKPAETCWCMSYDFNDKLREKIRSHEKTDGTACVCRNCLDKMKLED